MITDPTENDYLQFAAQYFEDAARCVNPIPAPDAPSPAAERMYYYEGLANLARGLQDFHLRVVEELQALKEVVGRSER
jgi:hypothetical protein